MRNILLISLLFLVSCTETNTQPKDKEAKMEVSEELIMLDFQPLLDSANVDGSILVYSVGHFFSNDFEWAKQGQLPASTFKIPNSIIALELGVMEDDSTMILWDGQPRFLTDWEQDLHFREAFHYSCVPCYQEIARKIGMDRMRKFVDDFDYGNMIFDNTTIDQFWLEGDSKINQFEQIDFLKRFNEKRLPISDRTYEIMSRMMIIEETDEYVLRGKTGWSVQNDINNCWFVGYVEFNGEAHYFATNIRPESDADISEIVSVRKQVTRQALSFLGIPISVH